MGEVDVAAREVDALRGRVGRALGSLLDRWTRGRDGHLSEGGAAPPQRHPAAAAEERPRH
jgi:hypothetical protein